jgi:hypothetical protein
LPKPPAETEETATLKWVRQSAKYGKYLVWRVSHGFDTEVAVRVICWFPPDDVTVVVVLFAGDKGKIGDIFYNSVPARADNIIEQWRREMSSEEGS